MANTRKTRASGSASRRGFMRHALRNALGAGASVAGLASSAAMAAELADPADGSLVLLMDPDGYLIDREMMLAEREALVATLCMEADAR